MLEISRADVRSDEIVTYPGQFLRVPIENYLDAIDITPGNAQIAAINAINNPKYRFICCALARRLGKTFIANIIGQCVALVPDCNILIISPNYSLSQISFELQRGLISKFKLEVTKNNVKDRVIELSNGSTIRMGSLSQVDSCVGRSYDLIIFDEAALGEGEEAFNIALRPTLDKPNSKALFISTPRGKNNWFSLFFQRGFMEEYPNWCSIHATYHENPRVSEEDIEEARNSMSKAEFEQEYLASFNIFEGQVWQISDECIADLSSLDTSDMDIIIGIDWGFRDATAFVVIAYDYDTSIYYILDEYKESERTTEQHAEALLELCNKYDPDFIFADSAAQQTRWDLAMTYGISTNNAKKSVLDGIGFLSSLFDNNRVCVHNKCKHVLYSLDQYCWDTREGIQKEKTKHNEASHMADAMRYALYSFDVGNCGVF